MRLILDRYIDLYGKYAFFDKNTKMKRIHSTAQQTIVPTGRIAFTDPGLQSTMHMYSFFPQDIDEGTAKDPVTVSIRHCFVAKEGYVFLSADYCQFELRIIAHLAKDDQLVKLFNQNGDPFQNIASFWFDRPNSQITEEERQTTKHVCYGLLYGMGAKSLAVTMNIDQKNAVYYKELFKIKFSTYQPIFRIFKI